MAVSTNGWSFITSSLDPRLRTITIPGTTKRVTLRRGVAPVFAAILADIHKRGIVDIQRNQQYTAGWNPRRTSSGALSNHGSGTATDMRWDVLKPDGRRHMSDAQRDAVRKLLDLYSTPAGKRILGWGGDYQRTQDEMHLEIGQAWQPKVGSAVTKDDVKAVKRRLGITRSGVRKLRGDGTPRKKP